MSEISSDTNLTRLSVLAEQATAKANGGKMDALDQRHELALPTRVLAILDNAGITTVEQLKTAGPHRLRKLDGLGKLGFRADHRAAAGARQARQWRGQLMRELNAAHPLSGDARPVSAPADQRRRLPGSVLRALL